MSTLLLVRHGQAQFLQPEYDRLSPLGEEQARGPAAPGGSHHDDPRGGRRSPSAPATDRRHRLRSAGARAGSRYRPSRPAWISNEHDLDILFKEHMPALAKASPVVAGPGEVLSVMPAICARGRASPPDARRSSSCGHRITRRRGRSARSRRSARASDRASRDAHRRSHSRDAPSSPSRRRPHRCCGGGRAGRRRRRGSRARSGDLQTRRSPRCSTRPAARASWSSTALPTLDKGPPHPPLTKDTMDFTLSAETKAVLDSISKFSRPTSIPSRRRWHSGDSAPCCRRSPRSARW